MAPRAQTPQLPDEMLRCIHFRPGATFYSHLVLFLMGVVHPPFWVLYALMSILVWTARVYEDTPRGFVDRLGEGRLVVTLLLCSSAVALTWWWFWDNFIPSIVAGIVTLIAIACTSYVARTALYMPMTLVWQPGDNVRSQLEDVGEPAVLQPV